MNIDTLRETLGDKAVRIEQIGGQVLIQGDCREIIGALYFDAILTDPPYGIGINKSNRLSVSRGFGGEDWDNEAADMSWAVTSNVPAIIWGGNYFDLPAHRAPLVWDKNNAGRDFADFELAWTNLDMVARRFVFRPMNMDGGKVHPTQKPVVLMEWCLGFIPDATTILDAYAGSGSTAVACVNMGRKSICIERTGRHFETMCKRVDEATRQPRLFAEPAPKAIQKGMDL